MHPVYSRYLAVEKHIQELTRQAGRDPKEVQLIAVTKTHPTNLIEQAYQAGCRQMGENRVQEALEKIVELPRDVQWHLIGTLQSNKVSKAISHFALIHSIDTVELAQKISTASEKKGVITPILLQVNVSGEKTKHGLTPDEWRSHLAAVDKFPGVALKGLMTIAPFVEERTIVRGCFKKLGQLKEAFQQIVQHPQAFQHLSMGMSYDYPIAIEEGATLVRIGSAIFGSR